MARSAKDAFKEFYTKLEEVLPIGSLKSQFYSRNLLSNDHKSKLDVLTGDKEKVEYFLDKVIKPGLQIGYTKQFDEMLLIMQNSDDPPVKYLADEIIKFTEKLEEKVEAPLGMYFAHVCFEKHATFSDFAQKSNFEELGLNY